MWLALVLAATVPAGASADRQTKKDKPPQGGTAACELAATATFTPPLKSVSQPFSYLLDGQLTGCTSSDGGPATASVTAGKPGVTIQGVRFDEPAPSGVGGCREVTASGTLWIVWADGGVTIVDYSTTGVLATLSLSGTVVPSKRVIASDRRRRTIRTTRFAGSAAQATLVTRPDDATACSGAGVQASALDGPFALR